MLPLGRAVRHVLRWAWNALAVLSLLLCVGACVLWVRSYWVGDECSWSLEGDGRENHASQVYRVFSGRGGILLAHDWSDVDRMFHTAGKPGPHVEHDSAPSYPEVFTFLRDRERHWGFDFTSGVEEVSEPPWTFDVFEVVMPLWFVALASALLPAFRLLRALRARRLRRLPGLCPACSYDLRGNQSGVCPECGTAVAEGRT